MSLADLSQIDKMIKQYDMVLCLGRMLDHPDKKIVEVGAETAKTILERYQEKEEAEAGTSFIVGQYVQGGILERVQELISPGNDKNMRKMKEIEQYLTDIESICLGKDLDEAEDGEEMEEGEYEMGEGENDEDEKQYGFW